MSDHAPSCEERRPHEPTVNEEPQSSTSSRDRIGPSDDRHPPQNEITPESSDNTGAGETLEHPRVENNPPGLGARVRTLIDLSRDVMVELVGMLIMLNVGPQLSISDEQLAGAGFTPMTTSSNAEDVLYMRHHGQQGRGSGADASASGPYTREEAVSETRASMLWRIGGHSATPLAATSIAIKIVAYGSLPSQDIVTLDLDLSSATTFTDDFPAMLHGILRSGLPLTATIRIFRESAESNIARQAIESGGTAPTAQLLSHDEPIPCYPSLSLSNSGFHLLEPAEGIQASFSRVEEARQPESGSRWIVSGPWTFREASTMAERERRSLPRPRVPEDDGQEEE